MRCDNEIKQNVKNSKSELELIIYLLITINYRFISFIEEVVEWNHGATTIAIGNISSERMHYLIQIDVLIWRLQLN